MKKFIKIFALIIVVLTIFTGCASKSTPKPSFTSTPEPTTTLEPSSTPEPTNTPEPTATQTPEYCNLDDFWAAGDEIIRIFGEFNDQVQIFADSSDTLTGDYQGILVEVTRLQRELTDLDVPGCMDYLTQILDEAMSKLIKAVTYLIAGDLSTSAVYIVETTTQILLFTPELERLINCVPNCEP